MRETRLSGSGKGRRKRTRAAGTSPAAYFTLRGDRRSDAAVLPDPTPAVSHACGTRKPRQSPGRLVAAR
jgi:hypothetical protein